MSHEASGREVVNVERNADLLTELENKVKDAQVERGRHEPQWSINYQLYLGVPSSQVKSTRVPQPTSTDPDMHGGIAVTKAGSNKRTFSVNRIQNAIIVQTSVQTEQVPRPVYVPRETNEPPEIFLKPGVVERVASQGIEPSQFGFTAEQIEGAEQLEQDQFEALLSASVPDVQMVETEAGPVEQQTQAPVVTEQDFVFVTDRLAAEWLTQEVHSEWDLAHGDEWITQNILETNVYGHKDALPQWNPDQMRFELVNLYPYNSWIDRWATSTRDAQYYIIRQVLDLREARKQFPDVPEEVLNEIADKSAPDSPFWGGEVGSKYAGITDRRVVDLWTWWERNVDIPLSADEAVNDGAVIIEDSDDGQMVAMLPDGTPTAPNQPNWPTKKGIRQIQMLGDVVIFNGETEFADIPAARNRNIPIPESPYGQGEPQRLADLQQIYERCWQIFHEHFKFYAHPQQAIPNSVYQEIQEVMDRVHSSADLTYIIPDQLIQIFGANLIQTIPTPQLGTAIFQMVSLIGQELDSMAGLADVLRGEAKSEWSAALFEQATNAARGPIGFKARHTSEFLRHVGYIVGNLIVDFLDVEEAAKRSNKYPVQIIHAMKNRLKRFGFDVQAVVGGSGDVEKEQGKFLQLFTAGLNASPTFIRQMLEKFKVHDAEQISGEIAQAIAPQPQENPV